jgi:transformation/transcription domain-associated protein
VISLEASKIIPYYFQVVRSLFKCLNNITDNSNFVKEFVPMIQGLLETFLQAKEDMASVKETNEICYSVPAKLKNLIEHLPVVSRPLIDSMKQNHVEALESGITTIQIWVSALTSYPEILDPIIENILPELNGVLYRIFCVLPPQTFKLLGKLGVKTRQYFEEKEFRAKNL